MARLAPVHPRLPPDTPITDRVSLSQESLYPLSLFHPLMVSPFLEPTTAWHTIHAKADATGMNQRVALLLDWSRAATIEPLKGTTALTSAELTDATLLQQQGIRTSLVPPPPLRTPQAIITHCRSSYSCKYRTHRQLPQGRR